MAKKVKISDIADKLGLSPTTVSFVLNGREKGISGDTRRKVIQTAADMGYRKLPRADLTGWTRVAYLRTGVGTDYGFTTFYSNVYEHLQKNSINRKLELSMFEFNPSADPVKVYSRMEEILSLGVKVFLTGQRNIAEYLIKNGHRTVLIQGGECPGCVCVRCDDYDAGRKAAEHALSMGHRNAGIIMPGAGSLRSEGFKDCFGSGGGECDEDFRFFFEFKKHEGIKNDFCKWIEHRKGRLPTLFFCFADNMLFPVIRALRMNGLEIPEDVSLIGADNLYWGRFTWPAFTTIDLNEELFAEKTMDAILHAAGSSDVYDLTVPVRLVERETVKRL